MGPIESSSDVALPFVEEALAAGEPTLVAVQDGNFETCRALGGTPAGVTLLSAEECYETSARTRDKFGPLGPPSTRLNRVSA